MPSRLRVCEVLHCRNNNRNYDGPLFGFPKDSRLEKWLANLGPLKSNRKLKFVCRDHFNENAFTDTFRKRLNKFAVPDKQLDLEDKNVEDVDHPVINMMTEMCELQEDNYVHYPVITMMPEKQCELQEDNCVHYPVITMMPEKQLQMSPAKVNQVLVGHTSDVTSCDCFGDYLATCSSDKSVKLWLKDSTGIFSETDFSPLVEHTYGVNCVRFSPFGTLLASCSTDGKVILWNVQDGEKVCEIQHSSSSPIRVCAFSPTSAMFATGGDDEKVVLWDIATKSIIRILLCHEAMITALAFTPDCAFLLSCSTAGDILLWDARYGHGKCLSSVNDAHDLGVLCCDFSPQYDAVAESGFLSGNYTVATCGNDDLVKLWYIKTGSSKSITLIIKLEGHSGNVMCCRFSPDGTFLASTGGDKTVILWNPNTGQALQKLEGHSRYVTCCAFCSPTVLVTGSNDKNIVVWSLEKDEIINSVHQFPVIHNGKTFLMSEKKQNILCWNVVDVTKWLKSIELEDLIETFQSNGIDGKELMHLTHENMLNTLKIGSFGQRNKVLRGIQQLKNPLWHHVFADFDEEITMGEFYCPITHEVMHNPVVAADGYSYEKTAIEEWLQSGKETSPMTNETLAHKLLIPNLVLLQLIQKYRI